MKLEIINLCKTYGEKEVLKNINFTFEEGKIYGLLGRNGVGKTTFFNSLNGDITINEGKFYLENEYGRNRLNTQDIGYVVSTPIVPEFLTGREFLQFYLDINKQKINDLKDIDYYFDLVKLNKNDQNILLKEYSHGMKNKIQILVNIIANPKVILLDEPLTSLDIVVQEEMKNLLRKILNNKKLELIEKNNLNTKKYKDKIIKTLKDESND